MAVREEELIPVAADLYSIGERLKEIDGRYRLFYNARLGRYEIRVSGELQLTVPRGELDARVIARVRKTRVERADALLREIERACADAERAAEKAALDKAEAALAGKEGLCW